MRNKAILLIVFLLSSTLKLEAQALKEPVFITNAEYFFDTDPGNGNGISIPVTTSEARVEIADVEIDISGLSPGYHVFYLRVKDATNLWGVTARQLVKVPKPKVEHLITDAEVFFDAKLNFGAGVPITINDGVNVTEQYEIDIDANNLKSGFHRAYVRLKDDSGMWGNYVKRAFYLAPAKRISAIDKAEYFYDTLGKPGKGTAISANGSPETGLVTIENVELNTPSKSGFHRIMVRLGDDSGKWGIPFKWMFYQPKVKTADVLTEAEYFINKKTAFGDGTSVEISDTKLFSGSIDIPLESFSKGFSTIYIRLKDKSGVWGNYNSALTYIPKARTSKAKINKAEYFLSATTRPKEGEGFELKNENGGLSFDSVAFSSKALVTLTQTGQTGKQGVYVRAEDSDGVWGVPTPVSLDFTNQRMIQGQLFMGDTKTDLNLIENASVNILSNGAILSTEESKDFGLFTFADKAAGDYELRYLGNSSSKAGTSISDYGSSGMFTVSATTPQHILKDIKVNKPLYVIETNPARFETKMRLTAPIELSFSGKFVASSFTNSNVSLISDLRGRLSIQIAAQSNDSVLVIKPNKSLLPNEKITIYVNSTFTSPVGIETKPFSTFFRGQVSGGGLTFEQPTSLYTSTMYPTYIFNSYAIDVDNDSDIDVITYATFNPNDSPTDTMYVYFNDGSGVFTDVVKKRILSQSNIQTVDNHQSFIGDYDKDGDIDFGVFVLDTSGALATRPVEIYLFKNNGTGTFTFDQKLEFTASTIPQYVELKDVNYDGFPELIIPSAKTGTVTSILLNQSGVFDVSQRVDAQTTSFGFNFVDVTGDGMLDAIPSTNSSNEEKLYVGSNNLLSDYFLTEKSFTKGVNYQFHTFIIEDFSRNGKADILTLGGSGLGVFYQDEVNSDLYFNEKSTFNLNRGGSEHGFAVGDVDNNGRVDVINAQSFGVDMYSYSTNPSLPKINYVARLYNDGKSNYRSPHLVDFDNDGDLDLLLNTGNNSTLSVQVIKNTSVSTNNAPVITATIDSKDLRLEEAPTEIDISGGFSDKDGDDLTVSVSSSKASVVKAEYLANKITLTPISIGNATITLTVDDDKGGIASLDFIVYVNAPDNYTPRVSAIIAPIQTRMGDDSTVVDLKTVFSDPDVTDVLTFSVNNPNASVAELAIKDAKLIINPISIGEITVIVSASDGKASAETSFLLSVGPRENRAPVTLASMPNQTINLGDAAIQIDPTTYFSDPDGDVLTYSVAATDPAIAGGSFNASTNRILITGAKAGATSITITAQDPGGKNVSSAFSIFVNAKPRLVANLSEVQLILGGESATFVLSSLFVDDNSQAMTYEVNSVNPSVASISVSGSILSFFAIGEGATKATIKAKDATSESETVSIDVVVKTRAFTEQSSNSAASAYADGIPVKDWCLISIPGNGINTKPVDLFTSSLGGSSDFKLFSLNQNGEYSDVSTESGPVFSPGNALWFKTLATNQKFTLQTSAGFRTTSRTTQLMINQWVFISNPYEIDAAWSVSNSNLRLWKYLPSSKSWSPVSANEKLKPWNGYVAYMPGSGVLTISLDKLTTTGVAKLAKSDVEENPISMQADIQVGSNKLSIIDRKGAESIYDIFDEPLLPSTPDTKTFPAYFKTETLALVQDVRVNKSNQEDQLLDFRTLVVPSGNEFITWNSVYESQNFVMALVNESTYRLLAPGDTMKLSKMHKKTEYKVYFGTKEMIETHVLPETHQLFDNFPNPFNPTSTIRFALNKAGNVTLNVYDVLGRKVSTLVRANLPQGYHTVQFDGVNLASGVYLYRLQVDNAVVATKKMTLIK